MPCESFLSADGRSGGWKIRLLGECTDFAFQKAAYGEHRLRKLLLRQLAQEITLVLARIHALKDAVNRLALRTGNARTRLPLRDVAGPFARRGKRLLAAVMPCGDHVGPHLLRHAKERIKLDLTIAKHIRIRSAAARILVEHIIHHALAVLLAKIHEIEWNAQLAGRHLRHELILLPLAVPVERRIRIMPILHEHREHVVALTLQQQRRNPGVHSARKSHADLHNPAKILFFMVVSNPPGTCGFWPGSCGFWANTRAFQLLPAANNRIFAAGTPQNTRTCGEISQDCYRSTHFHGYLQHFGPKTEQVRQ